jgi:hypothetical protein
MLLSAVAVLVAGLTAAAADKPSEDEIKSATKAVEDRLKEFKTDAAPKRVENEALASALPKHHVFAVMYPLWPLPVQPPEKLKSSNLLVAGPDGKVTVITSQKELADFYQAALPAAKEEKQMKDAALGWLRLVEQLNQDGYYTFETVAEATKVSEEKGGKKVTARSVVMKGGNGDINVELFFGEGGKLTNAVGTAKLQIGARPKCHATKLLDPDPVIRAIVEQDLLIMGRAAKPYLDEQRAKASPELQKAIDRMWERIEKEGQ